VASKEVRVGRGFKDSAAFRAIREFRESKA
jgi:hypothetical protein